MRKIKTILRLHHQGGLSRRQIASCQDVGYGTVVNYLDRAAAAGLGWPLPPELGERELAAMLFPTVGTARDQAISEPDWGAQQHELKRPGMTKLLLWQEYREKHPDDGYSYSHFCRRYADWLGMQQRSMRQVHVAGVSATTPLEPLRDQAIGATAGPG